VPKAIQLIQRAIDQGLAWIIHEFCGEKRKDALKG